MNARIVMRIAFVVLSTYVGYQLGGSLGSLGVEYAFVGFFIALTFVMLEYGTEILSPKHLFFGGLGLGFGLLLAQLVTRAVSAGFGEDPITPVVTSLILGYLGVMFAIKNADLIDLSAFSMVGQSGGEHIWIPDTSVIVDGRLKGLIEARLIHGPVVTPAFILRELQALADSRDGQKRLKGRRGLELLEEIKQMDVRLVVYDQDYEDIPSVDMKLIQIAKDINGEILTEDYNLYRIALLQQARALNVNELALALRPAARVGETISVELVKEGASTGQGVGYLEDGTMVVVEGVSDQIGAEVECEVSQIRQTQTGRMLFARPAGSS